MGTNTQEMSIDFRVWGEAVGGNLKEGEGNCQGVNRPLKGTHVAAVPCLLRWKE